MKKRVNLFLVLFCFAFLFFIAFVNINVFAETEEYDVSVSSNVIGGTITVTSGTGDVEAGTTVTLSQTPAIGYVFDCFIVNNEKISGSSFTMPQNNVIINALYKRNIACSTCSGTGEHEFNCNECSGVGIVVCYDCDGYGGTPCEICLGSGSDWCDACDGYGGPVCNNCDGDGGEPCEFCDGDGCEICGDTGIQTCHVCNGAGITGVCEVCNGTAEVVCGSCSGQGLLSICPTCSGESFVTCPDCGGDKTYIGDCLDCGGEGSILSCHAIVADGIQNGAIIITDPDYNSSVTFTLSPNSGYKYAKVWYTDLDTDDVIVVSLPSISENSYTVNTSHSILVNALFIDVNQASFVELGGMPMEDDRVYTHSDYSFIQGTIKWDVDTQTLTCNELMATFSGTDPLIYANGGLTINYGSASGNGMSLSNDSGDCIFINGTINSVLNIISNNIELIISANGYSVYSSGSINMDLGNKRLCIYDSYKTDAIFFAENDLTINNVQTLQMSSATNQQGAKCDTLFYSEYGDINLGNETTGLPYAQLVARKSLIYAKNGTVNYYGTSMYCSQITDTTTDAPFIYGKTGVNITCSYYSSISFYALSPNGTCIASGDTAGDINIKAGSLQICNASYNDAFKKGIVNLNGDIIISTDGTNEYITCYTKEDGFIASNGNIELTSVNGSVSFNCRVGGPSSTAIRASGDITFTARRVYVGQYSNNERFTYGIISETGDISIDNTGSNSCADVTCKRIGINAVLGSVYINVKGGYDALVKVVETESTDTTEAVCIKSGAGMTFDIASNLKFQIISNYGTGLLNTTSGDINIKPAVNGAGPTMCNFLVGNYTEMPNYGIINLNGSVNYLIDGSTITSPFVMRARISNIIAINGAISIETYSTDTIYPQFYNKSNTDRVNAFDNYIMYATDGITYLAQNTYKTDQLYISGNFRVDCFYNKDNNDISISTYKLFIENSSSYQLNRGIVNDGGDINLGCKYFIGTFNKEVISCSNGEIILDNDINMQIKANIYDKDLQEGEVSLFNANASNPLVITKGLYKLVCYGSKAFNNVVFKGGRFSVSNSLLIPINTNCETGKAICYIPHPDYPDHDYTIDLGNYRIGDQYYYDLRLLGTQLNSNDTIIVTKDHYAEYDGWGEIKPTTTSNPFNITFDLNGKTITNNTTSTYLDLRYVSNYNLTITDNSADYDGLIDGNMATIVYVRYDSRLTIDNGNFKTNSAPICSFSGGVTIYNGNFETISNGTSTSCLFVGSENSVISIFDGVFTVKEKTNGLGIIKSEGQIIIYDGVFNVDKYLDEEITQTAFLINCEEGNAFIYGGEFNDNCGACYAFICATERIDEITLNNAPEFNATSESTYTFVLSPKLDYELLESYTTIIILGNNLTTKDMTVKFLSREELEEPSYKNIKKMNVASGKSSLSDYNEFLTYVDVLGTFLDVTEDEYLRLNFYDILTQPTEEDKKVVMNNDDPNATYQWYAVVLDSTPFDDEMALKYIDGIDLGSYEDGVFTSEYYDDYGMYVVEVYMNEEFGNDNLQNSNFLIYINDVLVTKDSPEFFEEFYYLIEDSIFAWGSETEFTLRFEFVDIEYTELDGETQDTLTSVLPGNYICKISYPDNYVCDTIESSILELTGLVLEKPEIDTTVFVYNGENQTYNIPTNENYTVTGNVQKNVGTYTITVSLVDKESSFWDDNTTDDLTYTFTINKGTYDMTGVKFDNATYTYDGNVKELKLTGNLPAGVTVTYETNTLTNVGTVTGKVKFTYDAVNYNAISDMTATLTINKATYDMSGIKFENANYTYDGNAKELKITGNLPAGVTVTYETNTLTNVGTVTGKAKFTYDTVNYNTIADMTATLTIKKATYDMSGVTFTNANYTYDGNVKELKITGDLPVGVTVTYENNTLTNVGSVIAKAIFNYDTVNYNAISSKEAKLIIVKATYDMSGVTFNDTTYEYDGKEKELLIDGTLPNGVTVTYENNKLTNAGIIISKAKFSSDNANYNIIKDMTAVLSITKGNYDLSGVSFKDVTYFYDGKEKELKLTGNLPEGLTATYTNNKLTNVGTVNATVVFTGDDNYNPVPNMTATMTIKENIVEHKDEADNKDVLFDIKVPDAGDYTKDFDNDATFKVNVEVIVKSEILSALESEQTIVNYNELPQDIKLKNEEVIAIYDVKLIQTINGVSKEIQPSDIKPGTKIIVKIAIPNDIDTSKITRILHVHSKDDIESIEFDPNKIVDGYYEMEIDRLSEFAFVIAKPSNVPSILLIVLFVVFLLFVLALWYVLKIRNFKNEKLNLIPVIGFIFELVLTVVLFILSSGIIGIIFGILNIIALVLATVLYLIKHEDK